MKAQIQEDMKTALRAQDKLRLSVIRMLLAAIKQREIDERIVLTDGDILKTINKMIKQRRESISQYTNANRPELAAQEQAEIDILSTYLPTQLADEEVHTIVQNTIIECQATSMRDMGTVMGKLKPKLEGLTDMAQVSATVKSILSQS